MLADFFTKPLQGKAFFQLRDKILNRKTSDLAERTHECVEAKNANIETYASVTKKSVKME